MRLNISLLYHLGNVKGFRRPVPGIRTKTKDVFLIINHNIRKPISTLCDAMGFVSASVPVRGRPRRILSMGATPGTIARQASLPMGFSRQEYWSGLPCPPPGELPNLGIKPRSPTLQADSLPSEQPGKPTFKLGTQQNT